MTIDACLSSKKHDWPTPVELFARYHAEFDFDLDAAAQYGNTKCARFIGPPGFRPGSEVLMRGILECVGADALSIEEWPGSRIWLNPPYGRGLKEWYAKVYQQVTRFGKTVAMLVPARTDTKYWHTYVWDVDRACPLPWVERIDFLRGRIKFDGAENGAPFPSAVIVFRDR